MRLHAPDFVRLLAELLGGRPDAGGFAGAGASDDPERLAAASPSPEFRPMLALENGVEMESECQLDRFAGSAGRGDDDDPPLRMRCSSIRLRIRRQLVVSRGYHAGNEYIPGDKRKRLRRLAETLLEASTL